MEAAAAAAVEPAATTPAVEPALQLAIKDLRALLQRVAFARYRDVDRPGLACFYLVSEVLNQLACVTTDGHRLARLAVVCIGSLTSGVCLDAAAAAAILKVFTHRLRGVAQLAIEPAAGGPRYLVITGPALTRARVAINDGVEFPNYKQVIPGRGDLPRHLTVKVRELLAAVRAHLAAPVILSFAFGAVEGETGEHKPALIVDHAKPAAVPCDLIDAGPFIPSFAIGANGNYVVDALKEFDAGRESTVQICFNDDPARPFTITSTSANDGLYVLIMPARL